MDMIATELLLLAGAGGTYALARYPQLRDRAEELAERAQVFLGALRRPRQPSMQELRARYIIGATREEAKITRAAWAGLLNGHPDRYPHALIVGPTGAGKTTFATALLAERPGQLVVITPKPDDWWGGLEVVTIDDDARYTAITETFAQLQGELRRRLVAAKRREPPGEQLTIVLDDTPALVSEAGRAAAEVIKLVARLGRSLRVRLLVLSQSERVRSLALEGEGDALTNFVRVALERGHVGTLHVEGAALPLYLEEVPRLAAAARLRGREALPRLARDNGATAVASSVVPVAMRQSDHTTTVAQPGDEDLAGLPADVVQRIRAIDWRTVERAVRRGAGTAAGGADAARAGGAVSVELMRRSTVVARSMAGMSGLIRTRV